jgi:hypothetical protein
MEWKKHVRAFEDGPTDDAVLADQRVKDDDGLSTGIIYQREHAVYQPQASVAGDSTQFDREFVI